ncbi:acyltransferase [Paraglaciecola marina]|uniref:acyltransferase n=1 Tax=Paraglaciecola marina TaxID=2500157 RepID=UPI00105F51DA|nr:acyltransferase [Paraglaciecola marina]
MQNMSPDVPKGPFLHVVRKVVRYLRVVRLKVRSKGKIFVGNNITFGPNANLMIPNSAHIGNNFSCGKNFFVQTDLEFGNDCLISSDVSLVGNDHYLDIVGQSAYWSGRNEPSKITLEGDNFIGYRATLVGNIVVGKGAVIAAGAVVTKNVPEYSIVGGVPAKKLKDRFNDV